LAAKNKSCVDVIIPTLGENIKYLHESINSVISQAETNKVLICIDNKSSHKSELVSSVTRYPSDKLTVIKSDLEGVGETLNAGLRASSAPYIARQDDDDISESFRFAKQLKLLQEQEVELCFSGLSLFENENVSDLYTEVAHEAAENYFWIESLVLGSTLNHATLLSENFYKKENVFYSASKAEDYDLWLRIAKSKKIYTTSEKLYRYRQHGMQKTKNWNWSDVYSEIYPQWIKFYDEVGLPRQLDKEAIFNLTFNISENNSIKNIEEFITFIHFLVKKLVESEQKADTRYWDYLTMRVSEIFSNLENDQKVVENLKTIAREQKDMLFNIFMSSSLQLGNLKNKYNLLGEASHKIRIDNEILLHDNIELNKKFSRRLINRVARFFED
jgi:glycosyltransferase involved in cell wall biosynthesis